MFKLDLSKLTKAKVEEPKAGSKEDAQAIPLSTVLVPTKEDVQAAQAKPEAGSRIPLQAPPHTTKPSTKLDLSKLLTKAQVVATDSSSKPSAPKFSLASILAQAKEQTGQKAEQRTDQKTEESLGTEDQPNKAALAWAEQLEKVLHKDPDEPENINDQLYEELKDILSDSNIPLPDLAPPPPPTAPTFRPVNLTKEQLEAVELARQGKSFNLIGPAGSGKSTAQMAVASELLKTGRLHIHDFKLQGSGGMRWSGPSIAFCAFTRLAAQNLKKIIFRDPYLAENLQHNVTTIHNLLEFEPQEIEVQDSETGEWKVSQRFMPQRTSANPLTLTHLVIEESSQVSLELAELLADALPATCQIIFIGDLNQLPPPMGAPLLAWSSLMLPVVELKKVHRQAGESKVLMNAHKVLAGEAPIFDEEEFRLVNMGGAPRAVGQEVWLSFLRKQIEGWMDTGLYNPLTDIFLSPYGDLKHSMGSLNICKILAGVIGRRKGAKVFHIKAGWDDHYLAEGDDILYEKMQGKIVSITPNALYSGKKTMTPSIYLSRFGIYNWPEQMDEKLKQEKLLVECLNGTKAGGVSLDLDAIQQMIDSGTVAVGKEELIQASSHVVHLEVFNPITGTTQSIQMKTSGAFSPSNFQLAYALTVYKAQGQEWRNTFMVCHPEHSAGNCRESFYTGMTRSKEKCIILGFLPTVLKTIKAQKLKGDTLKEKLRFYEERTKGELPPRLLRMVLEKEKDYAKH